MTTWPGPLLDPFAVRRVLRPPVMTKTLGAHGHARGEIGWTDRRAEGAASEAANGPAPTSDLVLLAEDDPDLREIITSFLEARGRRVLALETIPEPWDGLAAARAKTAVIDVRWSTSPGFQTLVKMRQKLPDLPVIVIASFGDESVAQRARGLGAARVIEKPFDLEELDEALGST